MKMAVILAIAAALVACFPCFSEAAEDATVYRVCSRSETADCAKVPKAISAPDPEYSVQARENRIQGTVEMSVVVGPDGLVRESKVEKSLGYGLDEQALKALQQWRFEPATVDGKPVAVRINVQMSFRIYPGTQRTPPRVIVKPRF